MGGLAVEFFKLLKRHAEDLGGVGSGDIDVIELALANQPGGLAGLLEILAEALNVHTPNRVTS
jgi:hypothetical protein